MEVRKIFYVFLCHVLAFSTLNGKSQDLNHTLKLYKDSLKKTEKLSEKARFSNSLAEITYENFDSISLFYAQQAEKYADSASDFYQKGKALYNKGNALYELNKYDEALENYKLGIQFFKKDQNPCGLGDCFAEIGYIYLVYSNYSEAEEAFQKAIENYLVCRSDEDLAIVYHNLATTYDLLEKDSLAIETYKKCIEIANKYGMDNGSSYNNIGWLYKDLGQYDAAFEFFIKALKHYEDQKDEYRIGITYHNIGALYLEWNDYETAMNYFSKAYSLIEMSGDQKRMADIKRDMGVVYFNREDFSKADSLFSSAIEIYEKINQKTGLHQIYLNKGDLMERYSNFSGAINFYNESRRFARETGNVKGEVKSLVRLGVLYYSHDSLGKAKVFFKNALDKGKGANIIKDAMWANHYLAKISAKEGDYSRAWSYSEIYEGLRDSLMLSYNMFRVNELKNKYESEKLNNLLSQKDILLKEAEEKNKEQKAIIFLLVIGSVIIFLFAYLVLSIYRRLQSAHSTLKVQHQEIYRRRQELLKSKEKAEESERLKTAFLANISHEIRTPMNGIIGFSKLLQQEKIDPVKREKYVRIIDNNSNLLLKLINDTLELSKIELGMVSVKKEQFKVGYLFENLKIIYDQKIKDSNKNIEFCTEFPDGRIETIHTDGDRLYQIFINLLDNSLKFTEIGTITIGYKLKKDFIQFFVSDTGEGIPKNLHKVVFERFRQGDNSETRKFGGTGLGLTIVKGLVDLLQGDIKVESEPGKGTKVYFTIPLLLMDTLMKFDEKTRKIQPLSTLNYNWEGKTILVAEDEEINYFYIKETLEETGVNLIHAENGKEAVRICNENPEINLVLMDIKMPIMDGYEATSIIKRNRKSLPVVAQTAYAMSGEKRKSAEAGCDDYLFKPIQPELLLETISKYL